MGRDADQEGRAGFDQAVNKTRTPRQIVNNDLPTHGERHNHRAEAKIVTERAERIDDRAFVDVPVGGKRARIGEQRVVTVHHAFGRACRTRREGEIENGVGIALGRRCHRAGRVDDCLWGPDVLLSRR